MALEPNEMKQLITNCLNVYNALGDESRVVSDIELKQREKMRRSIVANKSLKKGSVISISDIDFKRPGNGFAPSQIREIEGKVLSQDIECDSLITQDHISGKSYNLNFLHYFLQFFLNVNKMIFNEELFDKHSNQTAVITSENKTFKYNDLPFLR